MNPQLTVTGGCQGDTCLGMNGDTDTVMDGMIQSDVTPAEGDTADEDGSSAQEDTLEEADGQTDTLEQDGVSEEDATAQTDVNDVPDLEGPVVLSISPGDEEEGVQLPFTVTITFNEPIREETVDGNTFALRIPTETVLAEHQRYRTMAKP